MTRSEPEAFYDLAALRLARDELKSGIAEPQAFERYADGEAVNWCAAFILWLFRETGHEIPGNRWKNRAVWRLQRELEAEGCRAADVRPGDIIVMRRGRSETVRHLLKDGSPGHIGIVDRIEPEGLITIEGNVRNRVVSRRHRLPSSSILAVYRWPLRS